MEEYIKTLTEQIRCKQARAAVAREVQAHMEDMLSDLKEQGMEEEEAKKKVLTDMGDPIEAGVALDRVHRPKIAWHMILLIGVLSLLGLGVQYMMHLQCPADSFFSLSRQLMYLVAGFVLMIGMYYLDYSFFGAYGKILAVVFLLFMLFQLVTGRVVNGATFYTTGIVSMSIPMLMLLYVPMYAGVLYACRGDGKKGILSSVVFLILPVWMTQYIPCMGIEVVLFLSLTIMFSIALKRGWFGKKYNKLFYGLWAVVLVAPPVAITVAIKCHMLAEYQRERIRAFIYQTDIQGAGYVNHNVRSLIGHSQLIGGQSGVDTSAILPSVTTDFIITHIITYYGILCGVLVLALLLLLVIQIFHVTIKQKNQLGMMIGMGCGSMLGILVLIYFLENVGALPYSYAYLPFFTAGGTGTIVTFLLLGVVLSVYKYKDVPLTVGRKKIQIKIKVQ